jgi:hypothetical protein
MGRHRVFFMTRNIEMGRRLGEIIDAQLVLLAVNKMFNTADKRTTFYLISFT